MKLVRVYCHSDEREKVSTCRIEFHPDLLAAYEKLGIIEIKEEEIDYEELRRLNRVLRIKRNCGVNTVGATIIVDLLDKIEELQDEVRSLRRK